MKAKGAELQAYYAEWPPGKDFYRDDGFAEDDDGQLLIDPNEEYDVEEVLGYLAWQGRGDMPKYLEVNGVTVPIPVDWAGPSSLAVFKAWRGDKRAYSVMLSPEDGEKFKALCAEHGWEVA